MDNIDELVESLTASMGKEEFLQLIEMTHRMGVLDAVVSTGTCDVDTVAYQLWVDKEYVIPLGQMKAVVINQLPKLEADGLIVDGKVTEEGVVISTEHVAMLNEDVQLQ